MQWQTKKGDVHEFVTHVINSFKNQELWSSRKVGKFLEESCLVLYSLAAGRCCLYRMLLILYRIIV